MRHIYDLRRYGLRRRYWTSGDSNKANSCCRCKRRQCSAMVYLMTIVGETTSTELPELSPAEQELPRASHQAISAPRTLTSQE